MAKNVSVDERVREWGLGGREERGGGGGGGCNKTMIA